MNSIAALGSVRGLIGAVVKDWARYRRALNAPGSQYLSLCNRNERLDLPPDGCGVRCDWQWTSDLHAPKQLPSLGLGLLRRSLGEHPIQRRAEPSSPSRTPDITFLIGHRGLSRLQHLLATLESIAGQRDVAFECVVVEQDEVPAARERLPHWVRHVHTPPPVPGMPYCRAWTYNAGARHARGRILVLHDNDMLVPMDYGREIARRVDEGSEIVNLKRFVFYLGEVHTGRIFERGAAIDTSPPEAIVQNLEAGGSVAITAEAYQRIGGMDEGFVGWGGEDNEFWERAQTLSVWPYGYLPLVHLWHAPQPEKVQQQPATLDYYRARSKVPAAVRIEELTARDFGNPTGPDPRWSPGVTNG